ncbi:Deoxynucleoside triphosphate triphosphohydrolase SAMHD1-like protein [Phytophthora ramorum]|uniref:Deoxynucleoside triphosphate triphosphohydrolase SAMHD1-like protein n=1 Tax=Phytophthora ramorum TaxID=164328 RepID=UPI003099B039|nr:Deoxynucleoside triphosphate triphosphohydrolase SAMHD1-like protein [Phytophthora ramorum]
MSSVWPAADDPRAKLFNDQVHGYIKLGTLYYVFPGASHNRFEHSLGVSFLSGQTVDRFRQQQPELELTERDSRLLSAAGLLHDLGHGPFSHVFEHEFMPRVAAARGYGGPDAPAYHHEDMSLRMIEYMVDDNNIDLERDDVRFIQQLIVGAKETHMGSRLDSRGYLYEIVANGRNCIDVDKFDYLARDMLNLFGLRKVFDFSRLTMFNRVIDNEICYHTSVNLDIYDMFQQRYQMHKQIYNHRKGKPSKEFQFLTDHVVHSIEASKSETLSDARAVLKRMRRRELYEFIDEYLLPPELMSRIPRFTSEELATQTSYDGVTLDPEDIIVFDGRLNYNFKDRNPVDNVSFYGSSDLNYKFHIPKEEVSLLFPEKFEERIIRVYSRNKSHKVHAAIHHAFRNYIRQFSTTLPPPSPSSKIYGQRISEHVTASKRKVVRKIPVLPVLPEDSTEHETNDSSSPLVSSPASKRLKSSGSRTASTKTSFHDGTTASVLCVLPLS